MKDRSRRERGRGAPRGRGASAARASAATAEPARKPTAAVAKRSRARPSQVHDAQGEDRVDGERQTVHELSSTAGRRLPLQRIEECHAEPFADPLVDRGEATSSSSSLSFRASTARTPPTATADTRNDTASAIIAIGAVRRSTSSPARPAHQAGCRHRERELAVRVDQPVPAHDRREERVPRRRPERPEHAEDHGERIHTSDREIEEQVGHWDGHVTAAAAQRSRTTKQTAPAEAIDPHAHEQADHDRRCLIERAHQPHLSGRRLERLDRDDRNREA